MKILKINEFIEQELDNSVHQHDNTLTETVYINDIKDFPHQISVKGGINYGGNKTKIRPHFFLKIKDKTIILPIPKSKNWNKNIIPKEFNDLDFKNQLIDFLNKDDKMVNKKGFSYLKSMILSWNGLNQENNRVIKIK